MDVRTRMRCRQPLSGADFIFLPADLLLQTMISAAKDTELEYGILAIVTTRTEEQCQLICMY